MGSPRRLGRWTPERSSFASNPDHGRVFFSTDHLAADAVVAYVDGVLSPTALSRAQAHMQLCPECTAEVQAQVRAKDALRSCSFDRMAAPKRLLGQLSDIPKRNQPNQSNNQPNNSNNDDGAADR